MKIKNRIKELRQVPARELKKNTSNWRVHSEKQKSALSAMLDEVGFAGAILVREDEDTKELEIIDGHLRADISDAEIVPVLVTDLTPEEAKKVLATFDPIGLMAETDQLALKSLLEEINFDSEVLQKMKAEVIELPNVEFPEFDEEIKNDVKYMECPKCGHRWPK